jgi:hypothetical protein
MSGFANSIVGGQGALIRQAIHSPNFVTGTTGWSINKDGSAEFHDILLTGGSLVVSGAGQGVFVYSSAPALGNLIVSIASAAGTDAYGNPYPQGINVTTGQISGTTVQSTTYAPPTYAATGSPLDLNPYFETNAANWTQFGGTLVRDNTHAFQGTWAGKFTSDNVSQFCGFSSNFFTVTPGEVFYLAGALWPTTRPVELKVDWYNEAQVRIDQSSLGTTTTTGQWNTLAGFITAFPELAVFGQVTAIMSAFPPNTSPFWGDALTVQRTTNSGATGWKIDEDGSAEFNDITARGTMQSSNYVPATTGWHIDENGFAEFHDVLVTGGSVVVTGTGEGMFVYSAAPALGNLITSIASAAGTDPYGNAYLKGLGVYSGGQIEVLGNNGTYILMDDSGAGTTPRLLLNSPNKAGITRTPASIVGSTSSVFGSASGAMILTSPTYTTATDPVASVTIGGPDPDSGNVDGVQLKGDIIDITGGGTNAAAVSINAFNITTTNTSSVDFLMTNDDISLTADGHVNIDVVNAGGPQFIAGLIGSGSVNWYRSASNQWKTDDSVDIDGRLRADSHVYGATTITPVTNTPTSTVVTGLTVSGSTFYGYVTPESGVPGDGTGNTVRSFSVNGVSGTGITLWIYRGGTTVTNMYYQVIGQ